jgi:ferric-dicitrate binding protein FerR (iron transport regulator)
MHYLPRGVDIPFMLRILRGGSTQEEKEFFDSWLAEAEEHKEEFAAIAFVWERTGRGAMPECPDPQRQWYALKSRMQNPGTSRHGLLRDRMRLPRFMRRAGIDIPWVALGTGVACVVLLIGLTMGILWMAAHRKSISETPVIASVTEPVPQDYVTGKGRRATVPLADGTVVFLNAASTLRVAPDFGRTERRVELEGEAYFAVAADIGRPFRVVTGSTVTEVRGTEFGVRYRRNTLNVVVSRGSVRVVNRSRRDSVDIGRGQGITATPAGEISQPRRIDLKRSLAWRENRLSFTQTPLDEVMAEIEAVYDVQVQFRNPRARNRSLTGYFAVDSIDVVLSHIAIAMDVNIRREGKTVVVY